MTSARSLAGGCAVPVLGTLPRASDEPAGFVDDRPLKDRFEIPSDRPVPFRVVRLPMALLSAPDDRFWCDHLHGELSAGTCVARQGARVKGHYGVPGTALYPSCSNCADGRSVESRVGDAPSKPGAK